MGETLKTGSVGLAVASLQQQLVEAGYPVAADELSGQSYGRTTTIAVSAFQAAHVGPDAHALAVDGIAGPQTLWALSRPGGARGGQYLAQGWRCDVSKAPPALVDVLREAVGDVGAHEDPDGSNDGPLLSKFHTEGRPWCALAVTTWAQKMAGGAPFGIIAGVYTLLDWLTDHGKIVGDDFDHSSFNGGAPMVLQPGDIFIIAHITAGPDGKPIAHGHTGLVSADLGGGKFATLEANSGNAVRGLVRDVASITHFGRLG